MWFLSFHPSKQATNNKRPVLYEQYFDYRTRKSFFNVVWPLTICNITWVKPIFSSCCMTMQVIIYFVLKNITISHLRVAQLFVACRRTPGMEAAYMVNTNFTISSLRRNSSFVRIMLYHLHERFKIPTFCLYTHCLIFQHYLHCNCQLCYMVVKHGLLH